MSHNKKACKHWQKADIISGGLCTLHARTCSLGVCRACLDNTAPGHWPPATNPFQRARIGTHIKTATTALGIKPCSGCTRRAQLLNGD